MKLLVGLVFSFWTILGLAQQPPPSDGTWIKKSIDAFDRVHVTRNASSEDLLDSSTFVAFVSGMLAVHRQNNLTASILVSSLSERKKALNKAASEEVDKQLRVAFAFTPLLAIPDSVSTQQIVAIVRKYLDANPQEWNVNAPLLITKAFEAAFARK